MWIIHFAIENPVKIVVSVILTVMFGILAFLATPVQLTPDVVEPEITVTTRWPGASAQEVEREIIDEQEEQLKSVEGLREFKSDSFNSEGRITLKFYSGTNLSDARAKVSDKLNQVPEYPNDAKEPTIATVNTTNNAIAWFILMPIAPSVDQLKTLAAGHPELREPLAGMLSGEEPVNLPILTKIGRDHPQLRKLIEGKNDPGKMRKFAEDVIEARFERVPGIANGNVYGGREMELRVVVDPIRLAAFGLTIADLRRVLQERNKNTSGGDIWEGKQKNILRTIGQYDTPEKVSETIIAHRDVSPVRIRDVAEVAVSYKKPDGVVRQKGIDAIAVNAQQGPGTNVLQIMGPPLQDLDANSDGEITQLEIADAKLKYGDSLRIALAELNIGPLKNKGLWLEQVYDQTDYVISATALVEDNIYVGGTLAVLLLLLFLRSARSVLIVGVTIPISVIGTFLFMRAFGRSINVISLAGMAFAVGMVVDNAIVVLENIFRHYQRGDDPKTASLQGTQQVWGAVLASTLTTLAVFVPVIFVQGQAGQLFRDIAIAISCAVGLSLIVSITVIPTLACRMLSANRKPKRSNVISKLFGLVTLGEWCSDAFTRLIGILLRMRGGFALRILIVVGFVTASIFGTLLLMPETEYLPNGNRNLVMSQMLVPPGYNLNKLVEIGRTIEGHLAPHWEAEPGSPEAEQLDGPCIAGFFFVARGKFLFMGARSADELRAAELVPVMRRAAGSIPGMIPLVSQASLFNRALSGGRTIDIEITGPDLERLVQIGGAVNQMCQKHFPPADGHQIIPRPGLDLANPELHILPDWEKASERGMNSTELGYAVDALVDGAYAGDYWHEGRKIDLVIYGADEYSRHSQDVASLPLATLDGKLVPLGSVASIKLGSGPEQVNHIERMRAITIQLKPGPQVALETALNTVEREIRQPMLKSATFQDGLYQIRLAGTADKLEETRRDLQWNLVLALVITYLLMAALFESFAYPLVIMTSIILALVGGFGGLAVLNLFQPQQLDMLTMLGFVILIGTVVNNAILIVHQTLNNIRDLQLDYREAITESVRTRIRPIFMSTLTTVLGMLPLVVRPGAGSELYRGLGSVVLGGLAVSTIFTLLLVPVGFSLMLDLKHFFASFRGRPAIEGDPATHSQIRAEVPIEQPELGDAVPQTRL